MDGATHQHVDGPKIGDEIASVLTGGSADWPPSVSNRWYSVVWTNDLVGGFTSLVSGIEFPQNSHTDSLHVGEGVGFYQVEVELK